jgi:adenylate cyclase class 2
VEIDLDVLPFGRFVEIEGPAEDIGVTAARLGLASLETSSDSYHELHRAHRLRQGLSAKDGFTFEPGEAQRILRDEGI